VAHVLSRGNRRAQVFHSAEDYSDFIRLLDDARRRFEVRLYAFCLMPNHFHVVAGFDDAQQLSGFMQLWLTRHVRRDHEHKGTCGHGHIWQDRFKSFQIQEDAHLLTVLRYVLRNPVRAKLVESPWAWQWSSLWFDRMLSDWPIAPPQPVRDWLEVPLDEEDEESVRRSIRRNAPFGEEAWQRETARASGLESTLRPLGRPKAVQPYLDPDQIALF
jgi:putative transposase